MSRKLGVPSGRRNVQQALEVRGLARRTDGLRSPFMTRRCPPMRRLVAQRSRFQPPFQVSFRHWMSAPFTSQRSNLPLTSCHTLPPATSLCPDRSTRSMMYV
jgi:hypothetical protein